MTDKMVIVEAITERMALEPRPARTGWLARWKNRFHVAMRNLIPLGYEDATGFHYGVAKDEGKRMAADAAPVVKPGVPPRG